ncbi:hypothetical protein WHR41_04954 [Cladosporium halotolerans]|uniref:C2H2-type domain-containing protein n=1 Tax=Cladosporium halotolerans TaxID=1052096 RepID=A0AB34KMC2_9PEZI
MAMAVDSRQQPQFAAPMGYDTMRYAPPQFTNPWVSGPTAQSHPYATSLPPAPAGEYKAPAPSVSAAYPSGQVSAPTLPTDGMGAPRPYGASYTTTAAPNGAMYAPVSQPQPQYSAEVLQRGSPYNNYDRRSSHPSVASTMLHSASEAERQSFSDALDASRGMVAMAQSDITPRNIYGQQNNNRASSDSYGFPSAHSAHSSISSASTYGNYYNSSVSEASVGDYSSASESVDMPNSRTLPRPSGLIGGNLPPAPQSMMGQFSSKVSSSSQKKHKCKICDKRFTRPSSLQTHMYSHTGEKPFACDVDGCGRHFSVVSNLRRHRKVHKGEGRDHPSPVDDE